MTAAPGDARGSSADRRRFRSRVDAWVPLVLFGPLVAAGWMILDRSRDVPDAELLLAGVVCAAVFALLAWIVLDTSYTLSGSDLIVRSGPVRATIPVATIRRVRRSSTILAGPALSLRRLEIDHGRYDTAIVSPADVDGFLAALRARHPGIELP